MLKDDLYRGIGKLLNKKYPSIFENFSIRTL